MDTNPPDHTDPTESTDHEPAPEAAAPPAEPDRPPLDHKSTSPPLHAAKRRTVPPRRGRPARTPVRSGRPTSSSRPLVVTLSVLSGLVAVVAIVAFTRSPQRGGNAVGRPPGGAGGTTVPAQAGPTTLPESAFTTFRDPTGGFDLRYPREWERLESRDPNVRLGVRIGGDNALSVRVQRFEQPTTSENIENIKAFTDGVVGSNATAKVLQQRAVTIDGMPGYFYLYTYTDEATGNEGVHAHYFLFRGRKANQIVFQASPDDFERLAPVFDQIISSFRSDPDA